jgi:putative endonuclease
MAWTYLLQCADGSFYVGSTLDLERRFAEHQNGEGAAYTRRPGRRPVQLLWAAEFARVEDAFAYEKRVQGWSRAKRVALIEGRYGDLPALASRAWRHRQGSGGAPGG